MRIRVRERVVSAGSPCDCKSSGSGGGRCRSISRDQRIRRVRTTGVTGDDRITKATQYTYKRVRSDDQVLSVKCVGMSSAERNEVRLALNAIERLLNGNSSQGAFPGTATPNATTGGKGNCGKARCNGLRWAGFVQGSPASIVRAYLEFGKVRLKRKEAGQGRCDVGEQDYTGAYVAPCHKKMRPPNRTSTVYICSPVLSLALQGGQIQTRNLADVICHELYHLAGADEHAAFAMQPFIPNNSVSTCNL